MYITRLASNEIFSLSNKIHREVGRAKDLSAPAVLPLTFFLQEEHEGKGQAFTILCVSIWWSDACRGQDVHKNNALLIRRYGTHYFSSSQRHLQFNLPFELHMPSLYQFLLVFGYKTQSAVHISSCMTLCDRNRSLSATFQRKNQYAPFSLQIRVHLPTFMAANKHRALNYFINQL